MSKQSDNLIAAMEIIAQSHVKGLAFDKTIVATIEELTNADTGEYKISYEGAVLTAYVIDTSITYVAKTAVYVKVPGGDFSSKKLIEGKALIELQGSNDFSVKDPYEPVGPLWDTWYPHGEKSGGLIAQPGSQTITLYESGSTTTEDNLFQEYSKNYNMFRIKASFLTQFSNIHNKGNYGIIVKFRVRAFDGENEKVDYVSYRLDITSFVGNPYGYMTYSPQSLNIKVQPDYLLGLESIIFFQQGFETDKVLNYDGDIIYENTEIENIFVKDIELTWMEESPPNALYHLTIGTPQGMALKNSADKLDLIGKLVYNGQNVMKIEKCKCYWFQRDLSVLMGTNNYSEIGGAGWKLLENNDYNTLTIKGDMVPYRQLYKLVTIYNETIVNAKEIELYRADSAYNLSLVQSSDNDTITVLIQDNAGTLPNYVGNWYISLPDGSYSKYKDKQKSISIEEVLLYESTTFHCEVFASTTGSFIGNLSLTVANSTNESDVTVTFDGMSTYQYDANGDITFEDSERERTLQPKIVWKEGYGTTYKLTWVAPDGTPLLNFNQITRYSPKKSMIANMWVDEFSILHYTVRQKFDVDNVNNTLTLKMTTVNNQEYEYKKTIQFFKDGDQGTNGTTYLVAVRPVDSGGNPSSALTAIRYYSSSWYNAYEVRGFVYKNGMRIDTDSAYTLTYEWSSETLNTVATSSRQCTIQGKGTFQTTQHYIVKLKVRIQDHSDNSATTVYYNYPVPVVYNSTLSASAVCNNIVHNIPSSIVYSSSGHNPIYPNESLTYQYNGSNLVSKLTSTNAEILSIKYYTTSGAYKLDPVNYFIYEKGIASIKLPLTNSSNPSSYVLFPVMMYLNTYGNEAVNGWDGTSISLKDGTILAPQIGAGVKDGSNSFTGVIMGKDTGQDLIGLYGYQSGYATFGLKEDGTAFFGRAGLGQIKINGNDATIQGGGGGTSSVGMTITVANKSADPTAKAINIGGNKFSVQYNGELYAQEAEIKGTITADKGEIGGWTIAEYGLASDTTALYGSKSTQNYRLVIGDVNTFSVTKSGTLKATSGTVGGWELGNNYLRGGNLVLHNNGAISTNGSSYASSIGGNFYVTSGGALTATGATITGKLTTGNLTATGGTIGEWTIGANYLQGGRLVLHKDGSINTNYNTTNSFSSGLYGTGGNFSVTSAGVVTVKGTITATAGSIGGFTMYTQYGASYLTGNNIYCKHVQCFGITIRNEYNGSYYMGRIGQCYGNNGPGSLTTGVGINTTTESENFSPSTTFQNTRSIYLQSGANIGISAPNGGIWITSDNIYLNGTVRVNGNIITGD